MESLPELIERVHVAPRGRRVAACFDYDGTLIAGFSASAFYRHRLRNLDIGPLELARTLLAARGGVHDARAFADLLALSLHAWRGKTEEELAELGRRLFKSEIASHLHHEIWRLIEAHQRMDHTIVLASSATRFQVAPMAEEIGAHHVICTAVEVIDGRLTGRNLGSPAWGPEKARALQAVAAEHGFDLADSFAYSNGFEDVPLLESVGCPTVVEPEAPLAAEARRRGWPELRCHSSGGTPGPTDVARTVALYGGMAGAAAAGLGISLARRSRTSLMETMGGLGSDVGLTLAGIDVDVVSGAEHLWSARPCVFVFNHQSKLDPVVVMKLVRNSFTSVGKAEAKRIPLFGIMFQLAGVAFVERGNTAQARKALDPAVAKIRDEGLSLVIAPEGTRSPTPRLGPFKKGAFHIAMQAGVPIVPVVIRNAGEIMWRGAQTLRPGRVEVAVLPPVPTTDWTTETVAQLTELVRDQFIDTLAHWPGDPAPNNEHRRDMTQHTELELDGTSGRIAVHRWDDGDPQLVVLLAHGYGEHAGRYAHVAERLVAEGAAVYAPDHLGHGRSEGEPALIENFEDLLADLEAVDRLARGEHPGLPVVLIGHSMGGVIATRYVQTRSPELSALVLSGPVIGGNSQMEPLLGMDPIPEIPIDPAVLSRDAEVGRAYADDPLVYHGPFKKPTLEALFGAIRAIPEGPGLGTLPTLWIHGEEDALAPLAETRPTVEQIRGETLEQRIYPGAQHEVFNETNRDEVIDDVVAFVRRALAQPVASA